MGGEGFEAETIDYEGLEAGFLLVEGEGGGGRKKRGGGRGKSDEGGKKGVDTGRDVRHVGEPADSTGEEEAEAEVGRGRGGEEFAVVDCICSSSVSFRMKEGKGRKENGPGRGTTSIPHTSNGSFSSKICQLSDGMSPPPVCNHLPHQFSP